MNFTVSNIDVAETGINLVKSLFAPGIHPRGHENFDRSYTWNDFDPSEYDCIYDYVDRWESSAWPTKRGFRNSLCVITACCAVNPTSLLLRTKEVMERVYREVFNEFKDTYSKQDRHDCLLWISENNILDELRILLAKEESVWISLKFES